MSENKLAEHITSLLITDIQRRFFEESFPRIRKCLIRLEEKEIWLAPNQSSNSIGNLVLHLIGNLKQYIISAIGGEIDNRERDEEFKLSSRVPKAALISKLDQLEKKLKPVFSEITANRLIEPIRVQGFDENVTSILIHVTEHLSYHTGQIAMRTKEITDRDLGFYANQDLNATGDQ